MLLLLVMLAAAPKPDAGVPWSGVKLKTPKDCQSPTPGTIVCGKTALKWADAGEDDAQKLAVMMPILTSIFKTEPAIRDCVIGDQPGRCTVFAMMQDGKRVVSLMGVGKVKQRPTTFQCSGELENDTVPAPCNAIVTQLKL